MKAIKRIISLILVSIFVIGAVFISYTGIKNGAVVYATVNDDSIYVPLRSESDAVKCFQAYCKSRDLTIEGSLADAVTTFTTGVFNSACNEIGIDITELQAELKAEYDQSGEPVKFFLNDTGVMAMNRIFAQFLQDNELEVGDTDVNKLVHSGIYFTDADGYTCEVFTTTASSLTSLKSTNTNYGTPYKYNTQQIVNDFSEYNSNTYLTYTFNCSNETTVNQRINVFFDKSTNYHYKQTIISANNSSNSVNGRIYNELIRYANDNTTITETTISETGYPCVVRFQNTLKFGIFTKHTSGNDSITQTVDITNGESNEDNIYIVSLQINNNNYEGDTYINNEGDIINNPDNPDQPDFPDYPEEPTGNVDDWGAEMPDLNIPWYLQGKEDKFPWNIPFNIMLTLSLLKAEPQAPHFEGTMDFKFTTYDYEIDLSQFDDVAEVLRKMEVIAFLIGLMILTRNLIGW